MAGDTLQGAKIVEKEKRSKCMVEFIKNMELAMENNKKSYLSIFAILLFMAISCNSQNSENKKETIITQKTNSDKMENDKEEIHNNFNNYLPAKELNVKEFNAKCKGNDYRFTDDKGMEVVQTVNDEFPSGKVNGYVENRKFPNSAYKFYCEYDANGKLTKTMISFHGMVTAFVCFYNISGEIIQKEDSDMPYKFSIEDLINKMKTEYNIDIVDTRICQRISRGVYKEHNNTPLYSVYLNGDPLRGQLICYVIDGNTGKTLYITKRSLWEYDMEEPKSIVEEYIESLK